MKNEKLYLAGPEIFLPNAIENAQKQRAICRQYGFIGLHPMDNNFDLGERDMRIAMKIYNSDIEQIRQCNIVVANCNFFRGALVDDGTSYELGYGNALGKPSYGYINDMIPAVRRINSWMVKTYHRYITFGKDYIDGDGYLIADDLGTSINLMLQCGMLGSRGRLIEGDFETCLKKIRFDLDHNILTL